MRLPDSYWAWPTLCLSGALHDVDTTELLALVRPRASGTCRGGGPASRRGRSWSASSCCSRRRWPASSPIWLDWVARWPTPSATAAASAADVLRAWGKLGYPRRAKRLHECATVIATEHGDVVPDDVDTLLTLPGIGAYTARAVACFAYGKRVPVVDTNVRRVVARAVHGRADSARQRPRPRRRRRHCCPMTLHAPRFSVALMELGATVCTARSPECGLCPLERCAWRAPDSRRRPTPARRAQQLRGHRSPGPRPAAGCAARQRRSRHPRPTRRGVADRHRAARPRAGLAAGRRAGRADCRRPVCARR